jgi:long-chain acyl-CoA synthetase
MTIPEKLEDLTEKFFENIFIIYQDQKITYGEFKNKVDKFSTGLRKLGFKKDDKIGISLQNSPEFIISYFAILKLGGVVVPLNWGYKKGELEHIISDCELKGIIIQEKAKNFWLELKKKFNSLQHIIIGDGRENGFISFEELLKNEKEEFKVKISPSDVGVILYTAAQEGYLKGAMLTHSNLIWDGEACKRVIETDQEDRFLGVLPFFHGFGATTSILMPLFSGAKLYIQKKFSPEETLKIITSEKITFLTGVPTMFASMLFSNPDFEVDLSSLRACISGGAPLPLELAESFQKKYNIPIYQGFGITECSPVVSVNYPPQKRKINSCGRPFPGIEVKIFDNENRELPPDTEGEIVIKGPNVMKGYYRNEKATKEAFKGGYFHTGDIGMLDKDGYLYITGRKKEMLIFGGFNVYHKELERIIKIHPEVQDVKIVPLPHFLYGEVPKAKIVLKKGKTLNPLEIISLCREYLANYKTPREIEFVEKFDF